LSQPVEVLGHRAELPLGDGLDAVDGIPSASGLSLYTTFPLPITAPPNPGNAVPPITTIREKSLVELREKRQE